jgi:signal transduction histidine kinase
VVGLLLLGVCGAAAGLLMGVLLAQRLGRSFIRLNLTIQDTAGKLNEVLEPLTLSCGGNFHELEDALGRISDRVSSVVKQLQQSQQDVLRAEHLAALGQMAAGLAHELRNPLTAIKVLVQSAAAQGSDGVCGHDLVILQEEISRLENAIQNFLDFARPPRLQKSPLEMRLIGQQTLDLVAARARYQRVRLETDLPNLPVVVGADAGQLRQVLLNLLLNAFDVLPRGGKVQISLRTWATPSGNDTKDGRRVLCLEVSDTGPGIPSELADRIFEPFVSSKDTGMGLGLAISKQIVEAHGGTITGRSPVQGGSVFTVELPLLEPSNLGAEGHVMADCGLGI